MIYSAKFHKDLLIEPFPGFSSLILLFHYKDRKYLKLLKFQHFPKYLLCIKLASAHLILNIFKVYKFFLGASQIFLIQHEAAQTDDLTVILKYLHEL